MYYEGQMPTVINTGQGNNGNGGMGNFSDGWWGIILLAILFGLGKNGGVFGGNGGGGSGNIGYELGKMATTNDVASGFNNSAVLGNLNDLRLGQAGIQQTLCQGFGGVNTAIVQNGYETRSAISDLGYRLQDCCCATQRAIDGVNYNLAKNTCDIITAGHNDTQRIIDFLTNDKISTLTAQNAALTAQLSNNAQTATLINELKPCPKPAYITCNPYQSYGFPYGNFGCNQNSIM